LYETTPKWHGFLMIKLVAFQASGYAYMRLRVVEKRTAEYRMSKEGILSILSKKTERSDSTLRQSSFDFSEFLFRSDRLFFWPAAALKPETHARRRFHHGR
jgi:hypothetical protein